ncbi:hypothetical protein ACEQPO_11235 [Bacillus sp. SL00103]
MDVPETDQKVNQAPMIRINELESYRNAYEDDQATGISVDIQQIYGREQSRKLKKYNQLLIV